MTDMGFIQSRQVISDSASPRRISLCLDWINLDIRYHRTRINILSSTKKFRRLVILRSSFHISQVWLKLAFGPHPTTLKLITYRRIPTIVTKFAVLNEAGVWWAILIHLRRGERNCNEQLFVCLFYLFVTVTVQWCNTMNYIWRHIANLTIWCNTMISGRCIKYNYMTSNLKVSDIRLVIRYRISRFVCYGKWGIRLHDYQ